ncbi:hypothetical protein SNOG_06113 [Parastagonospora nodorum SN15]|uniref:Uncharacterized protein n=1 Tax=Phaeosphaeria nodorum (strain SN15 / ATCC MYA-4574 / FGSC 10173) TaxID=321614 RepID=Q0UQ51_PHANO|nr:hypothetical protein SNOG_06113 [Parastagonospora nodorum SN15]EAT85944.1 hypothetical protein SNOG_06113 [Parastagonospora nodorum SN15]
MTRQNRNVGYMDKDWGQSLEEEQADLARGAQLDATWETEDTVFFGYEC